MSKRSNTLLHVTFTLVVLFLVLFSIQSVIADDGSEVTSSAISMSEIEALSQLPISFTENMGQAPEEIAFVIQSAGYLFGFTYDGFYFIPSVDPSDESIDSVPVTKMTIEGADPETTVRGTGLLPGVAHYFTGSDESDWITDVSTYEGITYDNVLPGVDLFYSGSEGILKREFLLEPGITPESIVLVYEGVESLELAEDGTLLVHTMSGIMSESAPVSYQVVDGLQTDLESSFVLLPENKVRFYVDGYDPSLPLVIDPFLHYSTLLGGKLTDVAYDMAVDGNGNVYLVGATQSSNFPIINALNESINPVYNGEILRGTTDVFVTMITTNTQGNATIQFSTYLGGSSSEIGRGIAVDLSGNVYVTGETTSSNFPVRNPISNGATYRGGPSDAFVTKIQSGGGRLLYSTYIGGTGNDIAYSIDVDSRGDAYITGETNGNSELIQRSNRYPTTSGAYQEVSRSSGQLSDAFVSVIRQSGSGNAVLAYSTYLSGSNVDIGKDLVVDSFGKVYIVGTTWSSDLVPSGVSGYSNKMSTPPDAFVFKLDPSPGKQPMYATYLGGKGRDEGEAIDIDSIGLAYVTGTTTSIDFPKTDKGYQSEKYWRVGGDTDLFVSKLGQTGDLIVSTYLGGSRNDGVHDISVASDRVYIAGWTESNDYPRGSDTFKDVTSGVDAIVSGLNGSLSELIFSTNFGGHLEDRARAVHVSRNGEVYVAGHTNSKTFFEIGCKAECWNEAFPVLRWIDQTNGGNAGGTDAFLMKFTPAEPVLFEIDFKGTSGSWNLPLQRVVNMGNLMWFQANFESMGTVDISDIVSWRWTFGDGQNITGPSLSVPYFISDVFNVYANPGVYSVQLTACTKGGICETVQKPNYVIVEDPKATVFVSGNPVTKSPIYVLENTSFQIRWSGINPQPDRIEWEFLQLGVPQFPVKSSTSTTLDMREGLPLGAAAYGVRATPYYYSDGQMLKGAPITRPSYLNVLPLPKIQFWTNPTQGWLTGPFYVEKPATGTIPAVSMTLVDSVPATMDVIRWYYDDTPATSDNPMSNPTSHTYTKVGQYFPTVEVQYKSTGQVLRSQPNDANKVIVFDEVIPDFDWYPKEPMVGEAVTFTYNGTGNPISWYWQFEFPSSPKTSSTLLNPTYTYEEEDTYLVLLHVEDPSGRVMPVPIDKGHSITVGPLDTDLVTLTWEPKSLLLMASSPSVLSLIFDSPTKGLNTFEVTATITNTSVAGFTGNGNRPDWMGSRGEFRVIGANQLKSGLYQSVTVYGVSPFVGSTGKISLGTLEIQGLADGKAEIVYSNPQLGYGVTEKYRVRLDPAIITMKTLTYPTLPYEGMKGPQADLNGDGLIDDFNGDGITNAVDVQLFFRAYTDKLLNPPTWYDYNGNGILDLQDIILFYRLWSDGEI